MPDLGEEKEGGQVIYSEIEIGKVSELEVKWRCFAGRVALQNGQNARGGSREAAWNLSHAPQPRAPSSCKLQKTILRPRKIFSCIEGCTGGRKVAAE